MEVRGFEPRSEAKTSKPSTYIVQQKTLISDSRLNSKHPKRSQGFFVSPMLPQPNNGHPDNVDAVTNPSGEVCIGARG